MAYQHPLRRSSGQMGWPNRCNCGGSLQARMLYSSSSTDSDRMFLVPRGVASHAMVMGSMGLWLVVENDAWWWATEV